MKRLGMTALAAAVLSVGFGWHPGYGQAPGNDDLGISIDLVRGLPLPTPGASLRRPQLEPVSDELEARIRAGEATLGRLLSESRGQPEAVGLRVARAQSAEPETVIVGFRPADVTVDGVRIVADGVYVNQRTGAVEAEGNVTITTTREDGSTITMRADRMTIEEER